MKVTTAKLNSTAAILISMGLIETTRLILRPWRPADKAPFAELCADPAVMRYFPSIKTTQEANELVDFFSQTIEQYGYGFWATELRLSEEFIGFVGLNPISTGFSFTPCVEVGWRLQQAAWGNGYATEAAHAALAHGFDVLELDEIVAMTSLHNSPSENVMKKLGMRKDIESFMHPSLATDSPLREHILYRIGRADFV